MSVVIIRKDCYTELAMSLSCLGTYDAGVNLVDNVFPLFDVRRKNMNYVQNAMIRFVNDLFYLNASSYEERYDEKLDVSELSSFYFVQQLKPDDKRFENLCSLLKGLECVKYNISVSSDEYTHDLIGHVMISSVINTKDTLDKLDKIMGFIQKAIISNLKDYKEARWIID